MLIGVGIGPGDPELLTVRAVRLIREADAVFVPGEVAKTIIAPYRTDVQTLSFPMTEDEDEIRRCLITNAGMIAPVARNGLAVFCILGDPNFFGTFPRLCEVISARYSDIGFSSVPGISAITAFASVAGEAVSGGFSVSDGSSDRARVLLKVRKPKTTADALRKEGFSRFVLVERMYMAGERVYRDEDLPDESSYFSILYARR
ncbi:MAG: cobalt-factor II C(20)-methyltransferase [Methanomicrobiaceae archaeon]|nr:cobalt-factor II C(20)-methyltransferase [Methanomicrobiaceae archaeon]